jgi:hypothetical protein
MTDDALRRALEEAEAGDYDDELRLMTVRHMLAVLDARRRTSPLPTCSTGFAPVSARFSPHGYDMATGRVASSGPPAPGSLPHPRRHRGRSAGPDPHHRNRIPPGFGSESDAS